MPRDPGWTGPMTGPMRGHPLVRCRRHGGWWTLARPCPACVMAVRVTDLEAQLVARDRQQQDETTRRCAECRQGPADRGARA